MTRKRMAEPTTGADVDPEIDPTLTETDPITPADTTGAEPEPAEDPAEEADAGEGDPAESIEEGAAVAPAPTIPTIQPEAPFGSDPNEIAGATVTGINEVPADAPSGVRLVGVKNLHHTVPGAVDLIVPDNGATYEDLITSGITYHLIRGVVKQIDDPAHRDWLTGHPYYDIQPVG